MPFPAVLGLAAIAAWLAELGLLIVKVLIAYKAIQFILRSLAVLIVVGIIAQFIFAIEDLLETIVIPSIPSEFLIVLTWLPPETNVYIGAIASATLLAVQLKIGIQLWSWWTRGIV